MDHDSEKATELEQRVTRMLAGTAAFQAPRSLEAQVLEGIERRARVPWWQRRVPEWPLLAQLLFGLTGIATAAALLLIRPATPRVLGTVIGHPAAVLQRPEAELHTTLSILAVFHRLADTLAGTLPDVVWYGGMVLCAAAYVALFILIAFCYRLTQAPASR
ncbi:MAG TPA: hypothetical protein VGV09_13935 [Steroidobacteraceae bacterium]|nr:hypothetical protein [Steroidobacteraceae bacterium]